MCSDPQVPPAEVVYLAVHKRDRDGILHITKRCINSGL